MTAGTPRLLKNTVDIDPHVIEVQTGAWTGEEDTVILTTATYRPRIHPGF